jgi:3-oxoacyl-[acyl-carrier protein] reductase
LRDRARPDDIVLEVQEALGPIDALVNNAGIRREALLALTSDDDWDAVLEVNLGGLFRCCRAVLRGMIVRRRGSIVNVSSLSALHGVAGQAAYAASKAGILGLTRSLAREVGKRGIRVNAVVPGFVTTDLTTGLPEAAVQLLRAGECLPGGVEVGGVASAVLFLLSDGAAAITGQTLVVDAGASA